MTLAMVHRAIRIMGCPRTLEGGPWGRSRGPRRVSGGTVTQVEVDRHVEGGEDGEGQGRLAKALRGPETLVRLCLC